MAANTTTYMHKGKPFTAKIAEELFVELFAGRGPTERKSLQERALKTHLDRGGRDAEVKDVGRQVTRRALEKLQKQQLATNPATGLWEIKGTPKDMGEDEELALIELVDEEPSKGAMSFEPLFRNILRPLPEGTDMSNMLYVCAYPSHGEVAWYRGEDQWACWIASHARHPIDKFEPQPWNPEQAATYLRVYTSSPEHLENTIHGLLFFRGGCMGDPQSAPWFLTSPSEVAELVSVIDPHAKIESANYTQVQNG